MNETVDNLNAIELPSPEAQPELPPTPSLEPVGSSESAALAWLRRALPTFLVLAALGGLAFLGHHFGWTVPKFDELLGNGKTAKDDWCKEHNVPESACVECNESLMPKTKSTWCDTHGVHNCPFEHPEVAQLKNPPEITDADRKRADEALAVKVREKNDRRCKLHTRRIQFASIEVLDKMGIDYDTGIVWRGRMEDTISASGEITYAQPLVFPLSAPVSGRLWWVTEKGKLGASVKQGDLLALVDAAEVGKAKGEFLQAVSQVDLRAAAVERLRPLSGTGVSGAQFQEAEAALREAQIRVISAQQALVNLGLPIRIEDVKDLPPAELGKRIQFLALPPEVVKGLDPKLTTANLIPVKAPSAGIVTAVKVADGEQVDPSKTLFVVVDNRLMWLTLNVRTEDKKYLRTVWLKLNKDFLGKLGNNGVPDAVLVKLQPLTDQSFTTEERFLDELQQCLSKDELEQYKVRIMQYALRPAWFGLNDLSLDKLKEDGVPLPVLLKLKSLKDQSFKTDEALLDELKKHLAGAELEQYKTRLLNRALRKGQRVRFRLDGDDRDIMGELVWMSTAVDEKTRTIQVRADLPNPDGQLVANSFGQGTIILRDEKEAIVVPNEAVHWEGDCYIVFVRDKNFLDKDAPKVFHVRTVRLGAQNAQNTEIIAGVLPGEIVATKNSAALRAELLKNRLGEG